MRLSEKFDELGKKIDALSDRIKREYPYYYRRHEEGIEDEKMWESKDRTGKEAAMIEVLAVSDISDAQVKDKKNGLRLCPHCKGGAKIKAAVRRNNSFKIWVECENCGARSPLHNAPLTNEDAAIGNIERGVAYVVDAWNLRP